MIKLHFVFCKKNPFQGAPPESTMPTMDLPSVSTTQVVIKDSIKLPTPKNVKKSI